MVVIAYSMSFNPLPHLAPFNVFAHRADPDQAVLVRAARSWSTLFASGNKIYLDPTLVLGCVAHLVTCLATDASLTADPGVASSIPARSHTFVEIDYEIISTGILPSAESFKKDCCQLQAKVSARSTG